MQTVKSTCCYCGVGCGVLISTEAGRIVDVKGDPEHPANFGRLCTKGSTLHLTALPDARLLAPQRRACRSEPLLPASWDDTLEQLADQFAATILTHGPDSVGFYISGQLLTEDYYVFNKLAKGLIQTNNVDTNSRLCMSSSVAGHRRAFGADTVPGCYEDLDQADLLVLVATPEALSLDVAERVLAHLQATAPAGAPPPVLGLRSSPEPSGLRRDLAQVLYHQEEPFADTSIFAHYALMRRVAEADVKVLITGQGADEIFAGYPSYFNVFLGGLLREGRPRDALAQARARVALVGGDHSTPLGYFRALAKRHMSFGILHIDAHMDLRIAYEGFTYSHASILYNALGLKELSTVVQVGIRDFCEEEHQAIADAIRAQLQQLQATAAAGRPLGANPNERCFVKLDAPAKVFFTATGDKKSVSSSYLIRAFPSIP